MVTAISASPLVTEASAASSAPPAPQAASTSNRATAPDTATISATGHQALQASQDVDHDGDSH